MIGNGHAGLYVQRTVMLRACSMPSDLPVQADCAFNIITGFEEGGERVGRSVSAPVRNRWGEYDQDRSHGPHPAE